MWTHKNYTSIIMETLNNFAKAKLEYKLAIYDNPELFLPGYTREQWVARQERILATMERLFRPAYANEVQATKQFLQIIKQQNKMKNFSTLPNQDFILTCSQAFADISNLLEEELLKAEGKHPNFARTLPDALLVISEELGEAQRAYLQYAYERKPFEEIRKELIQTGAMVFRTLLNLDSFVVDAGDSIKIPSNLSVDPGLINEKFKAPRDFQKEAYDILLGQSMGNEGLKARIQYTFDKVVKELGETPAKPTLEQLFAEGKLTKWAYLKGRLDELKGRSIKPEIAKLCNCPECKEERVAIEAASGEVVDRRTVNYHARESLVDMPEYLYFNDIYFKKGVVDVGLIDERNDEITRIKTRAKRILFIREYEGISQDGASVNAFEAWVAARRPTGFNYSHSVSVRTPEGTVKRTIVYKIAYKGKNAENLPW